VSDFFDFFGKADWGKTVLFDASGKIEDWDKFAADLNVMLCVTCQVCRKNRADFVVYREEVIHYGGGIHARNMVPDHGICKQCDKEKKR
jgi:hypothetical protein